ncbi:MAG: four helix bundle protein [Clostridia bacterium]|nr:four helix bundle protein [Clostridia bacterium]
MFGKEPNTVSETQTAVYKSERFAVRIINLYKFLCASHQEYDLFRQLLRSGTSIGANLAEAEYGISENDFLSKKYIALKECAETLYWLRLLKQTGYLSDSEFDSIYADCEELRKMLSSATKTLKEKLSKK